MDVETDLFVQAFWVKCRETIRPVIDAAVEELRRAGHEAGVSTLEFSPDGGASSISAPALILTVHPGSSAATVVLSYRGDIAARDVEVSASNLRATRHDLSAIDEALVARQTATCFGSLLTPSRSHRHARRHRRPVSPLRQGLQQGRCR